jgi:hypothetical protein
VGEITTGAWGLWGFDVSFCRVFGFVMVVLHVCFVSDVFNDLLVFICFWVLGFFFSVQMAGWVWLLLDEVNTSKFLFFF